MGKFKKHFTKGFEDLIGREESAATYKGRRFSTCFKKLAETINLDIEEIKTEIRSNITSMGREEEMRKGRAVHSDIRSFSEIMSG